MKEIGYLTLILFLSFNVAAFAEKKIVLRDNEYGGITEIFTYSKEDAEFKEGFYRKTVSYDNKERIKSIEVLATEEHTKMQGWHRSITYYWGKTKIGEIYATDSHAEEYGFDKMIVYLDKNHKVSKREYFLRDDTLGAREGIYKRVVYYDKNERRVKTESLDKLGNVLKVELDDKR
jgi:hypothetical protein